MHLTAYGFSGLLVALSSSAFGIFVCLKSADRRLGRIWCLFTFSVAGYGFGTLRGASTVDSRNALLGWRSAYAFGMIWIAAMLYHFVCIFCEIDRRRSILTHYLIGLAFLLTAPTPLFLRGVRWDFDSMYSEVPGPVCLCFFLWWMGLVFYSHYVLIRRYRNVSPHKKEQIKWFFLAMAVGFTGGSLTFLPAFGIPVYPWGNFAVCLYPFIVAYAILKHRLMGIDLVIRKTLIYSVLTTILTALYLSIAALSAQFLGGWMKFNVLLSSVIAAGVASVLFNPLRTRIQRFVDKRFFREAVDREAKLLELSREILEQKSPGKLSQSLIGFLEDILHPKRTALYLRAPEGGEFRRAGARGGFGDSDERMPAGNLWVRYFNCYAQPVLRNLLRSYAGNPHEELLEAVAAEMKRLEVTAVFPLISQGGVVRISYVG